MANPGPATTVTTNPMPVSTQQALRLICVVKGLILSAAGDTVVQPLSVTAFVPTVIVTTNANVTQATATVGIYTAPAQGGTAVLTTAALTGQTTNAFAYVRAATAVAAKVVTAGAPLYINVGVVVATATCDLYLYGYDVS